jgi:response regulator RpfG family c-di-GMP phosphodiesterase
MTLLRTPNPKTSDAVRLLSAVGDLFGERTLGFGMRVANVAARFAAYRECEPEAIAAAYYAAALHRIGAIRVVVPRDAPARVVEIAGWDDPPSGAAIIAAARTFPAPTADAVRWHREAFDGTGFPDQLRWNSIPPSAMSVNIARAFVSAREEQGNVDAPHEALFLLAAERGSIFALDLMRRFREFVGAHGATCEAAYQPDWAFGNLDPNAFIVSICTDIDARQPHTVGRGDRIERLVRGIVAELGDPRIDPDRAAFAGRLTALARTGHDGSANDVFTLTRLGLEARSARAATSARILQRAPAYAAYAPAVRAIEEWYDGSGLPDGLAGTDIDPIARVLAVAIAGDALTTGDAARRIAAAAGNRLDPDAVAAYLACGAAA